MDKIIKKEINGRKFELHCVRDSMFKWFLHIYVKEVTHPNRKFFRTKDLYHGIIDIEQWENLTYGCERTLYGYLAEEEKKRKNEEKFENFKKGIDI